ncbi:uncharacterized protein LOC126776666 [Nymphalis io]|uniref:uncharacterized protein LOC126776666 n=1 Tax=Inachis io TaxID=171585 RepID=UPI002168277B|nr:uncharacterized protein LOC126776666 [Nymphalis io]
MRDKLSFLQTNVNHSTGALNLLLQSMAQWQIDLAVACEPSFISSLPHWVGDLDGTVAILIRSGTGAPLNKQSPKPTVVLGDFNAKSRAWGIPATNPQGRAVQVWALLSSLSLLNKGQVRTCVRQQGGSVVDISFATPVAARRACGTPEGANHAPEVVSWPAKS